MSDIFNLFRSRFRSVVTTIEQQFRRNIFVQIWIYCAISDRYPRFNRYYLQRVQLKPLFTNLNLFCKWWPLESISKRKWKFDRLWNHNAKLFCIIVSLSFGPKNAWIEKGGQSPRRSELARVQSNEASTAAQPPAWAAKFWDLGGLVRFWMVIVHPCSKFPL